ncbi:VF530 family protein [Shewanella frigidimarina]|uniref:VF530 family protein n=1 Tax=Shewanella frigidimarina TaxID=56812 RepID=UPI00316F5A38
MTQENNPLHGIKLETIVTQLVEKYGWEELGSRINIQCFKDNPSVKSTLKFLRKTPWARDKVEYLYLKANKLPLPPPKEDSRGSFASKARPAKGKAISTKAVSVNTSSNKTVPNKAASPQASSDKTTAGPAAPVNADIWGSSSN